MTAKSRILICDLVMNTTLGCHELVPASEPPPANYGFYTRYSRQNDLAMMSIITGIERTPAEFKEIAEVSGLQLKKMGLWSLGEVTLPSDTRIQYRIDSYTN